MKKTLILIGILSIALVFGCGKEAEEEAPQGTVEDQAATAEKVEVPAEPAGTEAGDTEPAPETPESVKKPAAQTASGKPVDVGDGDFDSEVLRSDLPVLVDFWAPWCKPCRIAAPVLEKMAEEYKGKLKVCKLNVDHARQTAMKYGIRSIPTLIVYKDGKPVDQIVGVTPNYEADLRSKIESHL